MNQTTNGKILLPYIHIPAAISCCTEGYFRCIVSNQPLIPFKNMNEYQSPLAVIRTLTNKWAIQDWTRFHWIEKIEWDFRTNTFDTKEQAMRNADELLIEKGFILLPEKHLVML